MEEKKTHKGILTEFGYVNHTDIKGKGVTKMRKTSLNDSCEMQCQKIGKAIVATPRVLAASPSHLFALPPSLYISVVWVLLFPLSIIPACCLAKKEI